MKDRETALLVIDAQVGLIEENDEEPAVHNKEFFLTVMQNVIADARKRKLPIYYMQDVDVAEMGDDAFAIHPAIAPLEGDVVIQKQFTDSFYQTTLDAELQNKGIGHIVVMGCMTEYCVDSTCRRAVTLGYDVTLVSDGHSTKDNGVLTADQIIAHHNRNLRGYDNILNFVFPRESKEDILIPIHNQYRGS